MFLLSLFIALSIIHTDIGVAMQGVARFDNGNWIITATLEPGQIKSAYKCKHLRVESAERYLYLNIDALEIHVSSPPYIDISFAASLPDSSAFALSIPSPLPMLLVQERDIPILQVLYQTIFKQGKGV